MYGEEGIYVVTAIKDLLPLSFGDEMLKNTPFKKKHRKALPDTTFINQCK